MKLTRLALAALLLPSSIMAANAGVVITPLAGWNWVPANVEKKERQHVLLNRGGPSAQDSNLATHAKGYGQVENAVGGLAVGVELTPWLTGELEYTQNNDKVRGNEVALPSPHHPHFKGKQQILSGNVLVSTDVLTPLLGIDTDALAGGYGKYIKPYVLGGVGYSRITADTTGYDARSYDTIGNVGLGTFVRLNDTLALRAEGRAIYNFDHSYWQPEALAGLQVVLGGHLKPAAAPVPTPAPVVEAPAPAPAPAPQQLTEDLKMELRVFFDTNKSNIKAQYQPEVAKVADKLKDFPNATAQIEGHTDSRGSRKLNERLSLARANAVKTMLVSQYGIDAGRLTTQGFAFDRPIASNKTKEGRAMNRRAYAIITGSRTVTAPADAAPAPAAK